MKDYGIFCMAMAMPQSFRDEMNMDLDLWWHKAANMYEHFLLSPYNKSTKSELDCIHEYMRDNEKYHSLQMENEKLKKEMQHRLDMILDDINCIYKFIQEKDMTSVFLSATDNASECLGHITNIQVACDTSSDECMSWRKYSKS